ncbi:hypothetical protein Acr_02g0011080 [Actinidia rufa]|uniref:Wall-associated receptor kinase C-terminal domain-containing protein n=1 Tax=Actinidia rufa TaxID=165716 RepID=A0A7J0E8T1_9ERIC|nr:hypothetical protein Acr_02g0011080 [Actinidia rufa]
MSNTRTAVRIFSARTLQTSAIHSGEGPGHSIAATQGLALNCTERNFGKIVGQATSTTPPWIPLTSTMLSTSRTSRSSTVARDLRVEYLIPTAFACTTNYTKGTFTMYATSNTMEYRNVSCNTSVLVQVNQRAAQALTDNTINVVEALDSGFGLQWEANDTNCERCVRSGGTCGSDSSASGSFVCYCSNQPSALTCNTNQVTSTGGTDLKLKLVIGKM